MTPRIRGRVGQITDPPELAGKWAFEIKVTNLAATKTFMDTGPLGDFATQEEALAALRKEVKRLSDSLQAGIDGHISGEYLDMKSGGTLRKWNDEN